MLFECQSCGSIFGIQSLSPEDSYRKTNKRYVTPSLLFQRRLIEEPSKLKILTLITENFQTREQNLKRVVLRKRKDSK